MEKDTRLKESEDRIMLKNKRKSERIIKKEIEENDIQLINCHCCKIVDTAINMITCCKAKCRETFCSNCVKKHNFKGIGNLFYSLKEYEAIDRWICYVCKNKCICQKCQNIKKKPNRNELNVSTKRNKRLSRKKSNIPNNIKKTKARHNIRESFSNIIFEEYDEDDMKEIVYVDEFCIYENDASISDSIVLKNYNEHNKNKVTDVNDVLEVSNNIIQVTDKLKIKRRKKNKIKKDKIYKILQNNNNFIINIDLSKHDELKLCINCSKASTECKQITNYNTFLNYFKNVSDTMIENHKNNIEFNQNRAKITELYNNFQDIKSGNLNNIFICYTCQKMTLLQKQGFSRLSKIIENNLSTNKEELKNLITNENINFINDKVSVQEDINLDVNINELKNYVMLLESFSIFQKMLVLKIINQCDNYIQKYFNSFSMFDMTLNNIMQVNNMYPIFENKDPLNILKNLVVNNNNILTKLYMYIANVKYEFTQFTSKFENPNFKEEYIKNIRPDKNEGLINKHMETDEKK